MKPTLREPPATDSARIDALIYVAKSHVPSRWANSVQVVHMVCAFAPLFRRVDLLVPFKLRRYLASIVGDVFAPYGERKPENVVLRYVRKGGAGAFEKSVRPWVAKGVRDALVYTRSIEVAHWVCASGHGVLFESHDAQRDESYEGFRAFVDSVNANRRSGVVCISRYLQELYRGEGLRPEAAAVFPDAVGEDFFRPAAPGGLTRRLGSASNGRKRIVYLGSLQEEKGAATLLEAARQLARYDFVVIGGTGEEAESLRRQGADLPNWKVLPAVEHREVPGILADADFLVMPYRREGKWTRCMSPLKMFEYMASARPILSANLPVLAEVLEDGETCLLFEPESVPSLEAALDRAEGLGAAGLAALGAAAREVARKHTWDARARGIMAWYREIAGEGGVGEQTRAAAPGQVRG